MSLLSASQPFYSERIRNAARLGQAGRYRVNVQIGIEQVHVMIQLRETRSFNYILDEIQPQLKLSDYQRTHTRIFLQTILGETEVLVNSRPNYLTERNIDYIGIPSNPKHSSVMQRRTRLWFCLMLFFMVTLLALGAFLATEFLVLRPRLVQEARKSGSMVSSAGPLRTAPFLPPPLLPSIPATPTSMPITPGTVATVTTSSDPPLPSMAATNPLILTTGLLLATPRNGSK